MSFAALPFLSLPGLVASSATCDYPSANNVRSGTVYAFGTLTGNLVLPPPNQVLVNIDYGSLGTEFTGTLTVGPQPPPAIAAITVQSSPFAAIALALRQQVAIKLGIDTAFVFLVANDRYSITVNEPVFAFIQVFAPQPSPNLGAGRLARNVDRRIRIYVYTRTGEDTYGVDDIGLMGNDSTQTVATPPVMPGHFVAEELVFNAVDDFPPVDAAGKMLTVGTLRLAEDDGPALRAPESDAGLIRSNIDVIATYVLCIDPTEPAP